MLVAGNSNAAKWLWWWWDQMVGLREIRSSGLKSRCAAERWAVSWWLMGTDGPEWGERPGIVLHPLPCPPTRN